MTKMKSTKGQINLTKLETRFLLNFVLSELNTLISGGELNMVNTNNVHHDEIIYKRKIRTLINKLEKLEKKFYN